MVATTGSLTRGPIANLGRLEDPVSDRRVSLGLRLGTARQGASRSPAKVYDRRVPTRPPTRVNRRTIAAIVPPARRPTGRRAVLIVAASALILAGASLVIVLVEGPLDVPDASPVYLVAVVAIATLFGTWPAIGSAIASFLLYDLLFIEPRFTLTVADPREWINLLLFLLVGIVIGRLVALQAERADEADRRAREALALFGISRALATASTVAEAAPAVLRLLVADSRMDRIWVATSSPAGEVTIVDSAPDQPRPAGRVHWLLARTPGDQPAKWVRQHVATEPRRPGAPAPSVAAGSASGAAGGASGAAGSASVAAGASASPTRNVALFRIRVEVEGQVLGSLWASRGDGETVPNGEETRLLSLAADQLGLGLLRDQLTSEATTAEVARQADALKSALLTSVSHDLRTPLSSIRAAAGSLMDPALAWSPDERIATAKVIDLEAERLSRLVRNLLDLSRIEGNALRPELEVFDLGDLLAPIVGRLGSVVGAGRVELDLAADLPPVRIDAIYLDEAITNLLENAARYAGPGARIRIDGRQTAPGVVTVVVEDGGPGVPADALPRLFEKFYRAPGAKAVSQRGMGIGLSVVKGLVEAMGGQVNARPSELGGLAVELLLPAAPPAPGDSASAERLTADPARSN